MVNHSRLICTRHWREKPCMRFIRFDPIIESGIHLELCNALTSRARSGWPHETRLRFVDQFSNWRRRKSGATEKNSFSSTPPSLSTRSWLSVRKANQNCRSSAQSSKPAPTENYCRSDRATKTCTASWKADVEAGRKGDFLSGHVPLGFWNPGLYWTTVSYISGPYSRLVDTKHPRGRGGGVLPMIGYTGRLRPKGVYFYDRGIKKGIGK